VHRSPRVSQDLPRPDLVTSLERRDHLCIVRVEGEVDLVSAPKLAEALEAADEPGCDLVVDLREVGFMDSTGLRVLLQARDRRRREARPALRLELTDDGSVARLLDLVGVRALFDGA